MFCDNMAIHSSQLPGSNFRKAVTHTWQVVALTGHSCPLGSVTEGLCGRGRSTLERRLEAHYITTLHILLDPGRLSTMA